MLISEKEARKMLGFKDPNRLRIMFYRGKIKGHWVWVGAHRRIFFEYTEIVKWRNDNKELASLKDFKKETGLAPDLPTKIFKGKAAVDKKALKQWVEGLPEGIMTPKEVMAEYGKTAYQLRRGRIKGLLAFFYVDGKIHYLRKDVEKWTRGENK